MNINFVFAFLFTVFIIIGFPLFIIKQYLCSSIKTLKRKSFLDTYGSFYSDYHYRRHGKIVLFVPTAGIFRILILVFTIIFMKRFTFAQLMLINFSS